MSFHCFFNGFLKIGGCSSVVLRLFLGCFCAIPGPNCPVSSGHGVGPVKPVLVVYNLALALGETSASLNEFASASKSSS